ncbi:hypothetical protein KIS1582_4935 [Cytobacillus firmus]|uniref:Uncharacterized protein n=1 Tax=Cytobacillus firmus TaxID=1399 RepID=A0A800N849_CYTFI|nr:hypothetical protein KIS1582_4935 [Cytobacillus firmus]
MWGGPICRFGWSICKFTHLFAGLGFLFAFYLSICKLGWSICRFAHLFVIPASLFANLLIYLQVPGFYLHLPIYMQV